MCSIGWPVRPRQEGRLANAKATSRVGGIARAGVTKLARARQGPMHGQYKVLQVPRHGQCKAPQGPAEEQCKGQRRNVIPVLVTQSYVRV